MGLESEYLFTIFAEVGETMELGKGSTGTKGLIPITGGTVQGPKLNGKLLPFGGDWMLVREDGILDLDIRAAIKTDDDAIICFYDHGIVDPSKGYFRSTPVFETGSDKYSWLNQMICVGVGSRTKNKIESKVYKIL